MKIGLVIDVFSPARGGGEGYLANLADALVARGHEVHVFADRWDDPPRPGLTYHRVPARFPGKTLPMMVFALRSAKAVAGHDLDVVHAVGKATGMNLFNSHGGVEAKWLRQSFRSISSWRYRVFKTCLRYLNPRHYFIAWLERLQYTDPRVLRYVAISDMVARDIREHYPVAEDKLRIVYNGVDTERFHPDNRARWRGEIRASLGTPPDAPVFLQVTNNFRLKGLETLVRALAAVRRDATAREAELWILGRGRESRYRSLIRAQGVQGAVRFLGWQAHAERLYAAADVYAHPTFYDACALSILEALATGIPAVTSATNGASGYIEEGVNGFVLPDAADHAACAGLLLRCLDPAFRERAAVEGRRRAEEFPLARNTEEILAVYEEVAAERRKREGR